MAVTVLGLGLLSVGACFLIAPGPTSPFKAGWEMSPRMTLTFVRRPAAEPAGMRGTRAPAGELLDRLWRVHRAIATSS